MTDDHHHRRRAALGFAAALSPLLASVPAFAESFGYGATAGAAFFVRLSDAFWAGVSVDPGAAAFDHDVFYLSPPSIS